MLTTGRTREWQGTLEPQSAWAVAAANGGAEPQQFVPGRGARSSAHTRHSWAEGLPTKPIMKVKYGGGMEKGACTVGHFFKQNKAFYTGAL